MNAADVLERAAAIVEERWCQGSYGSCGGPRCMIGAVHEAARYERLGFAVDMIATWSDLEEISDWNDAPGRKASEVAAKLREAAAKAREAGK